MKIYICARFGRQEEAQAVADELRARGHEVTSTWLVQTDEEMGDYNDDLLTFFAEKDLDEIEKSNALLYLSEKSDNRWGRGGRHVEFGYALGLEKIIYVVGPQENVFHWKAGVNHWDEYEEFFKVMEEKGHAPLVRRG